MRHSQPSLLLFATIFTTLAACKSDPDTRDAGGIDTGVPPVVTDSGSTDAPQGDALPPPDAEPDAGVDSGEPDDSGVPDDTGVPDDDSGVPDDAGENDLGVDSGEPVDVGPADTGIYDGGIAVQSGSVVITEYLAGATAGRPEFIEVVNTTTGTIDLTRYTVSILSRGALPLPIFASSDPTGSLQAAVLIAPNAHVLGVPNPATAAEIPGDSRFVFGTQGALGADAIVDTGDFLLIYGPAGLSDELDFRVAAIPPVLTVGPTDHPLIPGISTALDPGSISALGNDDARAWCAPLYSLPTRAAPNRNCHELRVSEVLYDYASVTTQEDLGREMIEIAGAGGGGLIRSEVVIVDATGAVLTAIMLPPDRMPLNGLFTLASDAGGGMTFVANANLVAPFALPDGSGAVQLVRNTDLLDAFGWGTLPMSLVDAQRGLPVYEGTPAADIAVMSFPASYARSNDEADSANNSTDFRYDPTPTPGEQNGAAVVAVTSFAPDDAIAFVSTTVTITGDEFTDDMLVLIGAEAATCTVVEVDRLSCTVNYPSTGSGTAERLDVTVRTRPEHGQQALLLGGFTWTTTNNESNSPLECDFCNLQFPDTIVVGAGQATPVIYGRIYEAGATDVTSGGPAPGIIAELGYGRVGTNPATNNEWIWQPTTFNVEVGPNGNDDEYQGTLTISTVGSYLYTYRYSLDGGLTYTYADLSGAGSNGGQDFDPSNLGTLTVN